ncbi:MAG: HU family DNA-binding protein [Prevotellaceae bacterium]|nr:HU family DNA-binding protein [Prevotellaceae bacterium]MCD8285090.1 HU family DNA-binding protein [Prevotellaceae bacterium]
MNNNEFIAEMARRTGASARQVNDLVDGFLAEFTSRLEEEDVVSIPSFGSFSVKRKMERVVVNPATKQRMLVPPKLSVSFKPSTALKEKAGKPTKA